MKVLERPARSKQAVGVLPVNSAHDRRKLPQNASQRRVFFAAHSSPKNIDTLVELDPPDGPLSPASIQPSAKGNAASGGWFKYNVYMLRRPLADIGHCCAKQFSEGGKRGSFRNLSLEHSDENWNDTRLGASVFGIRSGVKMVDSHPGAARTGAERLSQGVSQVLCKLWLWPLHTNDFDVKYGH